MPGEANQVVPSAFRIGIVMRKGMETRNCVRRDFFKAVPEKGKATPDKKTVCHPHAHSTFASPDPAFDKHKSFGLDLACWDPVDYVSPNKLGRELKIGSVIWWCGRRKRKMGKLGSQN
jgi:hypothetical protein